MNSLYQELNRTKTNDIVTMFKQSDDPKSLLINLISTNPRVAAVMKEIQANGGDAKSLFFSESKRNGC